MKINFTNYDGDWEANCSYCGKEQKDHQVILGDYKGVRHIHRQPCPEEQHEITKKAVTRGIITRAILLFYDLGKYLWDKIPLKSEFKILWKGIKHFYVSIRALVYLNRNKPK